MNRTYAQALKYGADRLKDSGITEYEADAWVLFSYVTGVSRASYLMKANDEISDELNSSYCELIEIRCSRKPLQYITHEQDFYGHTFYVDENVLVPRFDTEILVDEIIKRRKNENGLKILDICTGSGCIAISLCKGLCNAEVSAIDISEGAIGVAKKNAKDLDAKISFYKKDVLKENYFDQKYDVVVSNPPYIESDVIPTLMTEVKDYEPMLALDGGRSGLIFYEKISKDAKEYILHNGLLAFEIGYNQGEAVSEILRADGYKNIEVIKDYAGNDRVCIGVK